MLWSLLLFLTGLFYESLFCLFLCLQITPALWYYLPIIHLHSFIRFSFVAAGIVFVQQLHPTTSTRSFFFVFIIIHFCFSSLCRRLGRSLWIIHRLKMKKLVDIEYASEVGAKLVYAQVFFFPLHVFFVFFCWKEQSCGSHRQHILKVNRLLHREHIFTVSVWFG